MNKQQLDAIRARDAEEVPPVVFDNSIEPESLGEPFAGGVHACRDRRALLMHIDLAEVRALHPSAWIRGHMSHTVDGLDYDEECVPGRDPPSDHPGWQPLYSRPARDTVLLSSCLDAMRASMRNGGFTNWSNMIAAIEEHFGQRLATPPDTTDAPDRTPEG